MLYNHAKLRSGIVRNAPAGSMAASVAHAVPKRFATLAKLCLRLLVDRNYMLAPRARLLSKPDDQTFTVTA